MPVIPAGGLKSVRKAGPVFPAGQRSCRSFRV